MPTSSPAPTADNPDAEALDRLTARRHSCRAFLARPVDPAAIRFMLGMAQRAASWCNAQPWQVTVTSGPATDRLRAAFAAAGAQAPVTDIPFPEDYVGVYRVRRRDTAMALYDAVGIAMGDRAASARQTDKNFTFFDAPHLAVISTDRHLTTYGAVDCGAFIGNFLLAAESIGVAAIAQAAVALRSDVLHDQLGIPEDRLIVCGIAFGYEDIAHPANNFRTTRAPLNDLVSWVDA